MPAAIDPIGRDQVNSRIGERIGRATPVGDLAISVGAISIRGENAFDLPLVVKVQLDRNVPSVAEQIVADDVSVLAAVDLSQLADFDVGRVNERRRINRRQLRRCWI